MKLLIIKRNLIKAEIRFILNIIQNHANEFRILSNVPIHRSLQTIETIKYSLPKDLRREINSHAMDIILKFGQEVIKGKCVTDRLKFNQFSIWFYHKFRIYNHLNNKLTEIGELNALSSSYDKILVFGSDKTTEHLNENSNISFYFRKSKKPILFTGYNLILLLLYSILRIILGVISGSKRSGNKKHLIVDKGKRQKLINLDNLKEQYHNYILGYVMESADDSFLILNDTFQPKILEVHKTRRNQFSLPNKLIESYTDNIFLTFLFSKSIKKIARFGQQLKSEYSIIGLNVAQKEHVLILSFLKKLHGSSLFYIFKYLAFDNYFSKKRYISVTAIDENSPSTRCILDAAKNNGIITIGIQHGTIHSLHTAYRFNPEDIQRNAIPDYTITWGEYWNNILIQYGNYPEKSLKAVGQIRTDAIGTIKHQSANIKSDKRYDFPGRIVVFASQPQKDSAMRKKVAFDIYSAIQSMRDVHIVTKLHPGEKNDFTYYKEIALEAGLQETDFTIAYDQELYKLISISEIIITHYSTVGVEAIYFNKPLIVYDPLKQDVLNFHSEGVAFQATNIDELIIIISDILDQKRLPDEVSIQRFIKARACKIDGLTSKRCLDFIKSFENG